MLAWPLWTLLPLSLLACGQLEKDKAPSLVGQPQGPVQSANGTPHMSAVDAVVAKIQGVPKSPSSESEWKLSISDVADYQWKFGMEAETACSTDEQYSGFQPISQTLLIDPSKLRGQNLSLKLCVRGRNEDGQIQSQATEAKWLWTPSQPASFEQYDLLDGDHQITLKPRQNLGQWLVIRSPRTFDGKPEDGVLYSVDQRFANGIVIAMGPVAEVLDRQVKNTETWTYTIYAMNSARRYSVASTRTIQLADQTVSWIRKDSLRPGMGLVYPLPNNNPRAVCRARHFDPNTGMNLGLHPGRTTPPPNGDIRGAQCLYEFARVIYGSTDFELLAANKGDPMNKLRWERASATANGSFIPPGSLLGGRDEYDATPGQDMFVCRAYTDANRTTLESFGKVGPNLAGCRSALVSNGSQTTERAAMDVLVLGR